MMTDEKFRADQVGSLLRPASLLAARRAREAGPGLRFYTRIKTSAVRFAW